MQTLRGDYVKYMGRAKKKKKALQKKERRDKRLKGINVPFSLANSPRKLSGISNRHVLSTNIHNLNFVQANFENVKYSASNITNCNFRNAKFKNVDFIGTNLKGSNLKRALLENIVFYNANLNGVNFESACLKNVYFINCKLDKTKNLKHSNNSYVFNSNFEDVFISEKINEEILNLVTINKFKKHYVLTTKNSNGGKINKAIVKILLKDFTENEIIRTFKVLEKGKKRRDSAYYLTFGKYYEFFCKYLKKNDII